MFKRIILLSLIFYKRFFSPALQTLFGRACRYDISCSEFAIHKIDEFGILKGGAMSFRRLLSCSPLIHIA